MILTILRQKYSRLEKAYLESTEEPDLPDKHGKDAIAAHADLGGAR